MLKIILSGCCGHMGQVLERLIREEPDMEVCAGFDILTPENGTFPVYSSPALCTERADAVIDFSSPAALDGLLEYGLRTGTPLVLATTGYTPEQEAQAGAAARKIPVFRSANMSLGINVLIEAVKQAAAALGSSSDIEIVERHHRRKVDAPSGTALMIAQAAASACGHETEFVYERSSTRHPRDRKEIGISSVRGGTIVGEHEVIFAGHDEVLEIRHTAYSREIFARGAMEAARFLSSAAAPGLYDMSMLVSRQS